MHPHKLAPHLGPANEITLKTFNLKLSYYSFIIHLFIRARFIWCTLIKLALGLGLVNEINNIELIKKIWSQIISLFLHHSFINQSQVCMVRSRKITLSLGLIKEIILRAFIFNLYHYSFIIYIFIRARFVWCTFINLASGLNLAIEIVLRAFILNLSYHSFIIYIFIRARFVWCTFTNLASGLGSITEIM